MRHEPPCRVRHRPGRPPRRAATRRPRRRRGRRQPPWRIPRRGHRDRRRRHRPGVHHACHGRRRCRLLLPQRSELHGLGRRSSHHCSAAWSPAQPPPGPAWSSSRTSTPTARRGARTCIESLPVQPTSEKAATRAAMTDELLAAHRAGHVEVAIGRASDYFGPGTTESALGTTVFGAALAGRRAQLMGRPDQLHSYSYTPDIAAALVTLAVAPEASGSVWHLPIAETRTTRQVVEAVYRLAGRRPRAVAAGPMALRLLGAVNPAHARVPPHAVPVHRPLGRRRLPLSPRPSAPRSRRSTTPWPRPSPGTATRASTASTRRQPTPPTPDPTQLTAIADPRGPAMTTRTNDHVVAGHDDRRRRPGHRRLHRPRQHLRLPRRPEGPDRRDPRPPSGSTRAPIVGWFLVLVISAALLAPVGVLLGRTCRRALGRWIAGLGIAAAAVQVIGLSRWILFVPGDQRRRPGPGADRRRPPPLRAAAHLARRDPRRDRRLRPHRRRSPSRRDPQVTRSLAPRWMADPGYVSAALIATGVRHPARPRRRQPDQLRRLRRLVPVARRHRHRPLDRDPGGRSGPPPRGAGVLTAAG